MKNIEAKINIDSSQLKSAFAGIDNLIGKFKSAFTPQKVVVDTKDATKEIDELKKSIGSMQGELMRMAKSGGVGSEEYVALQAKIKGARSELKLLADNSENVGNSLFNAGKKGGTAFGSLTDTLKVAGGQLLANVITSIGSAVSGAVTEFVEFDKQVKNIGTLGVQNFEQFSGLLTELSRTVPETTAGLAAATYDAISAGIQGTNEEIVKFVESAAKVGVAGLATTQEAVNGLSSVLNAYGMKASEVNQVSDTFFATIKLGKTTFGELNASLSNVIPSASAAGIKFDEVGAAISQMTALGTPTAQATTQIRQAIIELGKPTGALKEYFDKLGISGKDMTEKLKSQGLIGTLQELEQTATANGVEFNKLFGSSEASAAAILLTGKNAERTNQTLKQLREEIEKGAGASAYEVASKSLATSIKLIQNNVQALFTDVFAAVGPQIFELMDSVIGILSNPALLNAVKNISTSLISLIKGLMPAIDLIFNVITSAMGSLDGVLTPLIDIFGLLVNAVNKVITPIISLLAPYLETVSILLKSVFDILTPIVNILGDSLGTILNSIVGILKPILSIINSLLPIMTQLVLVAIQPLLLALKPLMIILELILAPIQLFLTLLSEVYKVVSSFVLPIFESFQEVISAVFEVFGLFYDIISEVVNSLVGGGTEALKFSDALSGIGDVAKTIANVIKGVADGIRGFVKDVKDFLGVAGSEGKKVTPPIVNEDWSGAEKQVNKVSTAIANNSDILTTNTKDKKDNVSATKTQVATYSDLISKLVDLEVAGKKGTGDYTENYKSAIKLKDSENERSKIQDTLNKQIETEILLRDKNFKSQQQIVDLLLEQNNISFSTDEIDNLRTLAAQMNIEQREANLLKEAELTLIKEKEKLLEKEARSMKGIFKELKDNNNRDLIPAKALEQIENYKSLLDEINEKEKRNEEKKNAKQDLIDYFATATDLSKTTSEAILESSMAFGEGMTNMLMSGTYFFEALGKSALATIVDFVQKQVLIEGVAILSKYSSTLGPAGFVAGLAVIGIINGLLGAAKAQLGAETGYMEGIKQVGKKGRSDTQMIWFNPKEVIIPEPMVNKNRDMLAAMFNGTNPETYYKQKYEKENTNTNFVPVKTSNSINANFTHSFKDIKVRGSDLYLSVDKIKRKELIRG